MRLSPGWIWFEFHWIPLCWSPCQCLVSACHQECPSLCNWSCLLSRVHCASNRTIWLSLVPAFLEVTHFMEKDTFYEINTCWNSYKILQIGKLRPRCCFRILLPDNGLFFLRAQQGKKERDSGEYWCRAANSAGSVTSRRGHLQVACKSSSTVRATMSSSF